jgi:hypothetical protein
MNAYNHRLRNGETNVAPFALGAARGWDAQYARLIAEDLAYGVLVFLPELCYLLWCEMTFKCPSTITNSIDT